MITLTLTLVIVFGGIHFKSIVRNCFGDQFPGCVKEICTSPPLRLDVPPFYTPEITLTLLNCCRINFQNITLTLTLLIAFEVRVTLTLLIVFELRV